MSNQEMVDLFRQQLANLLVYKKTSVIDSLNQTGFPASVSIADNELISLTLKGLATNESFKNKVINLMGGSADVQGFRNFAPQPEKGGMVVVIGADDLNADISTGSQDFVDFRPFNDKCNGIT